MDRLLSQNPEYSRAHAPISFTKSMHFNWKLRKDLQSTSPYMKVVGFFFSRRSEEETGLLVPRTEEIKHALQVYIT